MGDPQWTLVFIGGLFFCGGILVVKLRTYVCILLFSFSMVAFFIFSPCEHIKVVIFKQLKYVVSR